MWPWFVCSSHRSSCLFLLNTGIKGTCNHAWYCFILKIIIIITIIISIIVITTCFTVSKFWVALKSQLASEKWELPSLHQPNTMTTKYSQSKTYSGKLLSMPVNTYSDYLWNLVVYFQEFALSCQHEFQAWNSGHH